MSLFYHIIQIQQAIHHKIIGILMEKEKRSDERWAVCKEPINKNKIEE